MWVHDAQPYKAPSCARTERQSGRMSKITNDGLTRSCTGCLIAAVPIWQQWASKGYSDLRGYDVASEYATNVTVQDIAR